MNYTVQDIFDSAIRLIDEQNESTGSTETADTKPYRVKAVSLVRNLIPRVYPVSDTYAASADGKRPAETRTGADWMPRTIGSFSKRATKPKIVVTPVEMRQSMRQTP